MDFEQVEDLECYFPRLKNDGEAAIAMSADVETERSNFLEKIHRNEYAFKESHSLCGARPNREDAILLACKDRFGFFVNTWISKRSGLLWSSPVMTEDSLEKYYRKDYRALYNQGLPVEDYFLFQLKRGIEFVEWLKKHSDVFDSEKTLTVAEVGCGSGGILKAFQELGCRCFGSDFDENCIEYGQSQNLDLQYGDETVLKEKGEFDIIICSHLLEHLPHPPTLMESLREMLADDGVCLFVVPGIYTIDSHPVLKHDFQLYLQNAHLHHFCKDTLAAVASRSGFEVVAADEQVRMLLRKNDAVEPIAWDSECFTNIIRYLEKCEKTIRFSNALNRMKTLRRVSRMLRLNRILDRKKLRSMYYQYERKDVFAKMLKSYCSEVVRRMIGRDR